MERQIPMTCIEFEIENCKIQNFKLALTLTPEIFWTCCEESSMPSSLSSTAQKPDPKSSSSSSNDPTNNTESWAHVDSGKTSLVNALGTRTHLSTAALDKSLTPSAHKSQYRRSRQIETESPRLHDIGFGVLVFTSHHYHLPHYNKHIHSTHTSN